MCVCVLQASGIFDLDVVNTQLHYSGIMDTILIRKEGYPIRMRFSNFLSRWVSIFIPTKHTVVDSSQVNFKTAAA